MVILPHLFGRRCVLDLLQTTNGQRQSGYYFGIIVITTPFLIVIRVKIRHIYEFIKLIEGYNELNARLLNVKAVISLLNDLEIVPTKLD